MSFEQHRKQIQQLKQDGVRLDSMGDQAWAAIAEHEEEIVAQCDNYSLPPVVRMALCMVSAELFRRQGDASVLRAETMLPPVTNEEG